MLDFKNQITNYQIWLLALRTVKIRTCLTLRTKMAVTKKVLKAKFDCTYFKCAKKIDRIDTNNTKWQIQMTKPTYFFWQSLLSILLISNCKKIGKQLETIFTMWIFFYNSYYHSPNLQPLLTILTMLHPLNLINWGSWSCADYVWQIKISISS